MIESIYHSGSFYYPGNPSDVALERADRGNRWETLYRAEIKSSVDAAIIALKLDKPYEAMDDSEKALADALFGSIISCFGPCFRDKNDILGENYDLYQNLHGIRPIDMLPQFKGHTEFTSNHNAIGVSLFPLDTFGSPLKGSPDHMNMPTFIRTYGGKPTLGDISPILISQKSGNFQLHLSILGGYTWNKLLKKRRIEPVFEESVGKRADGDIVYAREIIQPCTFTHPVTILRPTCVKEAADCKFCSVTRGDGIITPEHKEHVLKTFDELIFDDKARDRDAPFMLTLSGGSENSPDGGFHTAHEGALGKIREKIREAERLYKKKIRVDLELEMMLPPDKSPNRFIWRDVIKKINHYVEDMEWNIGLAINVESFDDETRRLFIPGVKGDMTIDDLIYFYNILKEESKNNKNGEIEIGTLATTMKPAAMDEIEYMRKSLVNMQKLVNAGIHPDLIPCKIKPGQALEAYPPPDPILYMIQYFALKKMIGNAHLKPKYGGCVIRCGHCHHVDATYRAMAVLKNTLPEKLRPILNLRGLDPEYIDEFTKLYSEN